jgi:hypothetical protein
LNENLKIFTKALVVSRDTNLLLAELWHAGVGAARSYYTISKIYLCLHGHVILNFGIMRILLLEVAVNLSIAMGKLTQAGKALTRACFRFIRV